MEPFDEGKSFNQRFLVLVGTALRVCVSVVQVYSGTSVVAVVVAVVDLACDFPSLAELGGPAIRPNTIVTVVLEHNLPKIHGKHFRETFWRSNLRIHTNLV